MSSSTIVFQTASSEKLTLTLCHSSYQQVLQWHSMLWRGRDVVVNEMLKAMRPQWQLALTKVVMTGVGLGGSCRCCAFIVQLMHSIPTSFQCRNAQKT
jgi:hypothetical protein